MDTCLDFAYVSNYLTFKIPALQRDPLIYKLHTHTLTRFWKIVTKICQGSFTSESQVQHPWFNQGK